MTKLPATMKPGWILFLASMLMAQAADEPRPAPASGATAGPAPSAKATADDAGKWQFALEDAADGAKVVTVTLAADAPIKSGFGEVTPILILRYRSGRTSAYVVFDTYLGEGKLAVEVQWGAEALERQTWRISTDGRSAFVPSDALAFMERLRGSDRLVLRAVAAKGAPAVATFTTKGAAMVVKALISAGIKYTH